MPVGFGRVKTLLWSAFSHSHGHSRPYEDTRLTWGRARRGLILLVVESLQAALLHAVSQVANHQDRQETHPRLLFGT